MRTMRTYYLLTEGPDDANALYHLLLRNAIPICRLKQYEDAKIAIEHRDGVTNLLSSLRVQLKTEDEEKAMDRIGVVIDADADSDDDTLDLESEADQYAGLLRRWQSIRDVLRDSGYSDVPDMPLPQGTIVGMNQDAKPRVGIWLMPDNQIPGKLEHFAQLLIPSDDTLWIRVEQCIQNISLEEKRFQLKDEIKAKIHTWLAWQREPGKPIGQAITKGFLRPDATHAAVFISWIRSLFELEAS